MNKFLSAWHNRKAKEKEIISEGRFSIFKLGDGKSVYHDSSDDGQEAHAKASWLSKVIRHPTYVVDNHNGRTIKFDRGRAELPINNSGKTLHENDDYSNWSSSNHYLAAKFHANKQQVADNHLDKLKHKNEYQKHWSFFVTKRKLEQQNLKEEYTTRSGHKAIKQELDHLKNVELPAVKKSISNEEGFRSYMGRGEYEATKERHNWIQNRIAHLEGLHKKLKVTSPPKDGTIGFGSKVTIKGEDGAVGKYHIVGQHEADFAKGKISHTSPLAKALIGRRVDDQIIVDTSSGSRHYRILKEEQGMTKIKTPKIHNLYEAYAKVYKEGVLKENHFDDAYDPTAKGDRKRSHDLARFWFNRRDDYEKAGKRKKADRAERVALAHADDAKNISEGWRKVAYPAFGAAAGAVQGAAAGAAVGGAAGALGGLIGGGPAGVPFGAFGGAIKGGIIAGTVGGALLGGEGYKRANNIEKHRSDIKRSIGKYGTYDSRGQAKRGKIVGQPMFGTSAYVEPEGGGRRINTHVWDIKKNK